ncbi:YgaP family membrane protein [Pedobacter sandarakinus]|uniref:YgaP family membrane protein n=1 Tax=Pedobacter sandarakinus TaxID=353156 RepID=UPI00224631F3|nr:DUF2892 domain-containing protein [Pedobacter sandarakinus]MCX2576294.1 DUF2892 domain-containing protein [Pedobacter sandarakinus]
MTNDNFNIAITNVKEAWKYPELFENVSRSERVLSGAVGGYLLFKGITSLFSHPVMGLTGAAIGAGLLYRGLTGYCPVKDIAAQEKLESEELIITDSNLLEDLA